MITSMFLNLIPICKTNLELRITPVLKLHENQETYCRGISRNKKPNRPKPSISYRLKCIKK